MNQTPNYRLNQWERADKVQMEDFNADNAKIDAALNSLSTQVAGKAAQSALNALSTQVAKCGNCKIALTSYVGKGPDAGPTVIQFPSMPLFVLISGEKGICTFAGGATRGGAITKAESSEQAWTGIQVLTWSGSTVSINGSNVRCRMNFLNDTYWVVALYSMG